MNKKETKQRKKLKKKQIKKQKKKLKKQSREKRYFTKTKNISVTVYFLIMSIVAMIILLTMLGILEI